MNMRTAFASDFDGTLYFHPDGGFGGDGPAGYRDEDVRAIRTYQEAGGKFGICTGRALGALTMQYYDKIAPDFIIALTGGLIVNASGEVIWRREAPLDAMREVQERYARIARMTLFISGDDYHILTGPMDFPMKRIRSLDELVPPHYGMSVELKDGEDDLARHIAAEVNRDFGDDLAAFANLASVDIVASGCSKGTGLAVAKRALGIDLMAGMGDSYNDLPMLEAADVAYTFDHAPAEVRSVADVLVSGVAAALLDLQRR